MRFSRKRLTDTEYVERLRKSFRQEPWLRRFNVVMGLALLVIAGYMIELFFGVLLRLAGPAQQNAVAGWFAASVALGTVAGLTLSKALYLLMGSTIISRSDRLVVDLWDALDDHLREPDESSPDV